MRRSSLHALIAATVLPHERLFLDHLPSADRYSKSFMHRDVLNYVIMTKYDCLYFPVRPAHSF
jgi:hypothetical protein